MKKLFFRFGSCFIALILFLGSVSVNGACQGPYYQPKVPEKMRKKVQ